MSSVLITIEGGTADYVVDGDVNVVCIDFDNIDPETTFPEDLDHMIDQIMSLPENTPWTKSIVQRLAAARKECRAALGSP